MRQPLLSVIITTYNEPDWLELCLESYRRQTNRNFEIIIADDGSSCETKDVINSFPDIISEHIWQPDNGFQKTKILNKAITASKSNYLLFTDGDCIAPKDLIETHLTNRRQNCFLSGSYYKLDEICSSKLNKALIHENIFNAKTLKNLGHKLKFKAIKFLAPLQIKKTLDLLTPTKATWNGHCSSGWKNDILKVNGFDERMTYGGLDRELGERLINSGIKPIQIRHRSCVIHLHHKQEYNSKESWDNNKEIRKEVKDNSLTWTHFGINQNNKPENK